MKRHIRFNDTAVSTVVSAVIAITIVVIGASIGLFWAVPYYTGLQNESNLENAENLFFQVSSEINSLLSQGTNEKNQISYKVSS